MHYIHDAHHAVTKWWYQPQIIWMIHMMKPTFYSTKAPCWVSYISCDLPFLLSGFLNHWCLVTTRGASTKTFTSWHPPSECPSANWKAGIMAIKDHATCSVEFGCPGNGWGYTSSWWSLVSSVMVHDGPCFWRWFTEMAVSAYVWWCVSLPKKAFLA